MSGPNITLVLWFAPDRIGLEGSSETFSNHHYLIWLLLREDDSKRYVPRIDQTTLIHTFCRERPGLGSMAALVRCRQTDLSVIERWLRAFAKE